MLQKIRYAIIGLSLAGTVISQKMIIAIEAGVSKTNELNILKELVEVLNSLRIGLEML